MDDDLQVVDDVIEIQDDEDLNDDACQLDVSDNVDNINMEDDGQADEIYIDQSNTDFHIEDEDDEPGEKQDGDEGEVENASRGGGDDKLSGEPKAPSTQMSKTSGFRDDFDDKEYDTDEENVASDEFTDDAEDYEKEFLNMPSLHSVMNELGSLKQGRRLTAQPLQMEELGHPIIIETFNKLSSEDIKLQFVRSKDNPSEWRGFLLMHFSSCNAAKEASEKLKTIRDDLEVKAQNETAYASKIMEQWIKDEKGQKKWTDTLVLVKNLPENVTVEQLESVFPDSEDVLIIKSHDRNKDRAKEAFIMYHDKEQAEKVANEARSSGLEYEGSKLKVFKYHVPQENTVKGLLKLSQRRTLLKYMNKLTEESSKETEDEDYKAPVWCQKRLEACQSALDKDDRVRKAMGLPLLSYDDLVSMKVKSLRSSNRRDALNRMGVIERQPRRQNYGNNHNSGYGGYNNRNYGPRGSFSNNRSKNFDSRNFQNTNRRSESLLGNPPSLTSMGPIVPPLLALQHNAGVMRMMMAQQQRTMEASTLRRGAREPPAKLLRMDEKGMYHNYRPPTNSNRGRGEKRPISLLDL